MPDRDRQAGLAAQAASGNPLWGFMLQELSHIRGLCEQNGADIAHLRGKFSVLRGLLFWLPSAVACVAAAVAVART